MTTKTVPVKVPKTKKAKANAVNIWTQSKAELELQRWTEYEAKRMGIEKLDLVVKLTHENRKVQKLCGYYETGKNYTHMPTGIKANTLALTEEFLNRNIWETLATHRHEMVHVLCDSLGIKDTSNNGRFHNKHFKATAEQYGLTVGERNGTHGYNQTSLSDIEKELLRIELNPDETQFELVRSQYQPKERAKTKLAKYECYCDQPKKVYIAEKTVLTAECKDCNQYFVKIS
jgi:hypothetical protein